MVTTCTGPHQRIVYSYEEAAVQLSISERGLRQLIADGELQAIGYGEGRRRRGVTHTALVAWVADRERELLSASA
jgi:excisionase family DNA binding protein